MVVTRTYRRDLGVRVIISFFLSLFFLFLGSDSLTAIIRGKYFLADLVASFILIFVVTSYISLLSTYFDSAYPWTKSIGARIIYQLIAGILVPSAFVLGYMYLYLIVILGFDRSEVPFFHTEFPIAILFIVFWNLVYAGYYFYYDSRKSHAELSILREQLFTLQHVKESAVKEEPVQTEEDDEMEDKTVSVSPKARVLVAVSGNKNIPIPVENIAYFFKKGNYTNLTNFQGDEYLLNHSLDELGKHLPSALFFRANRQFIINIRACHFFTNEENGKLAIHLIPPYEGDVTISQKRATVFRDWLNQDI